ncbi:MAG: sensor histidine kinase, partial [Ktedonobacterales bacterium]
MRAEIVADDRAPLEKPHLPPKYPETLAAAQSDGPLDLTGLLREHLQAPLANIKSAALALQSVSRRAEPGARHEMARLIAREADTVREALALAEEIRGVRAGATLRLAPVELSDVLMNTLAAWKPLAPNHSFELAMPGEVPPITGDEECCARALHFLIEAAVRLAPVGGTVRADIRPQTNEVIIRVRQSGQTLAPEALTHYFEPFSRHT